MFTGSNLWKYSVLGFILFLIVFNVFLFVMSGNSESNKYVVKSNLVVALMLLFNHIAFTFTKTGWKSRVMKTVAFVWIAFGFAYIFWVISSSGLLAD
jgi:formate hydrogenlyase subunit 4